jgi:hypothetical protein
MSQELLKSTTLPEIEYYICNIPYSMFVFFEKFSSQRARDEYYSTLHPDYRAHCYKAYKTRGDTLPTILTDNECVQILVDHLVHENKFKILSLY